MTFPPSRRVDLVRWRAALADVTGGGFDDIVAAEVALESSVLAYPIVGIDSVWRTLTLLETMYEETRFTQEIDTEESVHFSWEGRALGLTVKGITTLDIDREARVNRILLHHRPFGAVLQLSTTLADRLPPAPNGSGRSNGTS